MLPRTALAAALVLLLASLAVTADPYSAVRTSVVSPKAGPFSIALCERLSPGLNTHCDAGGLGMSFFDVSAFNAGTDPAASSGTCRVTKSTSWVGELLFVCGADLDDDGAITASDDSTSGSVPSGASEATVDVCVHPDSAAGGDDWDDVVVILASGTVPYAGLATSTLTLEDAASC